MKHGKCDVTLKVANNTNSTGRQSPLKPKSAKLIL